MSLDEIATANARLQALRAETAAVEAQLRAATAEMETRRVLCLNALRGVRP